MLRDNLQAIYDHAMALLDALEADTPEEKRTALATFGIVLTADSLSDEQAWGKAERIEQAYQAVKDMIEKLAIELNPDAGSLEEDDWLRGALQFENTFSGTELQLIAVPILNAPQAAASTSMVDRDPDIPGIDTPVIAMSTVPQDANGNIIPNYVHSKANIVHEFGHVLLFKAAGAIEAEWQTIRNQFSPFEAQDGWDFNVRENKTTSGPYVEVERLADLFLFWIYRGNPNYPIYTDSSDSYIRDRALALDNFAKGIDWVRNNVNLQSSGFKSWIEQVSS